MFQRRVNLDPSSASAAFTLGQAGLLEGLAAFWVERGPDCPAALLDAPAYLFREAFKTLKGDLAIRPIFHSDEKRIEAHIFIAFLAYCLHVTLGYRLKHLAPGLTTRSALEKFCAVQMIDVHIPTTDKRELVSAHAYTQPALELKLLWNGSS